MTYPPCSINCSHRSPGSFSDPASVPSRHAGERSTGESRDGGDHLARDAGARLAVRSRLKDGGRGAELAIAAAYLLFVKRGATARGEPLNGASRQQPRAAW